MAIDFSKAPKGGELKWLISSCSAGLTHPAGISQKRLAETYGLNYACLRYWTMENVLPEDVVPKICEIFGVLPQELSAAGIRFTHTRRRAAGKQCRKDSLALSEARAFLQALVSSMNLPRARLEAAIVDLAIRMSKGISYVEMEAALRKLVESPA